jgi:hypothetical protein
MSSCKKAVDIHIETLQLVPNCTTNYYTSFSTLSSSGKERLYHFVRKSDTLKSISESHRVSIMNLRKYNREYFPKGEKGKLVRGSFLVYFS